MATAQEHDTQDCPSRAGQRVPRECATCRGEHEAWSRQCPTRKDEIAKAKTAYEMRPRYHHVAETAGRNAQLEVPTATVQRNRPSQTAATMQAVQLTRIQSQTRQAQRGPMPELPLTQWSRRTSQHKEAAARGRKDTLYPAEGSQRRKEATHGTRNAAIT